MQRVDAQLIAGKQHAGLLAERNARVGKLLQGRFCSGG